MTTSPTFDITGALPRGRMAIEASAGTGKTYALASLALRFVAEAGFTIDQLLLVTFTHSAADDLRDRVRRRFIEASAALSDPTSTSDALLVQLSSTDGALRKRRIDQALTDFDSATITTIHSFATQVLAGQGASTSASADAVLIGTEEDLIIAVCTDVLARAALEGSNPPESLPKRREFAKVVNEIRNNPGLRLSPSSHDLDAPPAARILRRLVDEALEELRRRHQLGGTLSYSDVLTELRDLLVTNPGAVEALRRRYRVALIDEFQDTDPVQWEFLSLVFGERAGDETLILVGDPKQSIYSFRGADVHTYLKAAFAVGTVHTTLGTNWRSDGALLCGLDVLFSGATFGDENIGFVPVQPAPMNAAHRIRTIDGTSLPGLVIRAAIGDGIRRNTSRAKDINADAATEAINNDLADLVRDHLEFSEIPDSSDVTGTAMRRVEASDIAVLIGANHEGPAIQSALRDRGVPAVIVRGNNVLASKAEPQWRELLTAIARPGDPERARTAALGWFFGWSASELDGADDEKMAALHDQLFEWAAALENAGTDEFFARLQGESHIAERLLASASGERDLTDIRHIGSLLRTDSGRRGHSVIALLATLDRLCREAARSSAEDDVFARQIESDARAVQIMTVHRAKGLEFPIVCVPSLYRGLPSGQSIYFDPVNQQRTYDLAEKEKKADHADSDKSSAALARVEAQWEHLRRLYVATTRGKHQSVIWWSRTQNSGSSGLAHVLFAREDGVISPDQFQSANAPSPVDPADAAAVLQSAFAPAGDAAAVTVVDTRKGPVRRLDIAPDVVRPETLQAASLGRVLDRSVARLSFSSVTARIDQVDHEADDERFSDAGASDEDSVEAALEEPGLAAGSDLLLGAVAGSARFGNLVHSILQRVDFSAADLDRELMRQITEQSRLTPWEGADKTLASGLRATIETPLGAIAGGRRLRDFAPGDHLNEVTFELRFAHTTRPATVRDVGALICAHLGASDPFSTWARELQDGLIEIDLAGHLTGSIDLVLRVRGEGGDPDRYVICDYKTNRLGSFDRDAQSMDYHPSRLPHAMIEHHYPLQALLYSVALHRYLRWRIRDYRPELHLGGAAYLFIRGMAGAETPLVEGVPHGVFPWNIPPTLVCDLSDLFESGVG